MALLRVRWRVLYTVCTDTCRNFGYFYAVVETEAHERVYA